MSDERPDNSFDAPGLWLKGAIHVHTTNSDGRFTPGQAMEFYRGLGFDFIAFGDHWCVTQFDDPVGAMLVLPGAEYDARVPDSPAGFHFLAVGARPGREDRFRRHADDPGAMAREISAACDYLVVAHPYWSALTTDLIAALSCAPALEVYNHGCEVEDGLGYSMYVWDQLLARGHRLDAVAVDDAHWRRDDDHGGGWVWVKARERTAEAVIEALRAGRYYSSSGPEVLSVEFIAPRRLRVRCSPVRTILFRCNGALGNGLHAAPAGRTLAEAEHDVPERAIFLRVEVTDEQGRKAWTNPFYLRP